jgi:hypothetical protein
MPLPPKVGDPAVSQMTRQELIVGLLQSNEKGSFEFTEEWLNRQWTHRLRALLAEQRRTWEKAADAT